MIKKELIIKQTLDRCYDCMCFVENGGNYFCSYNQKTKGLRQFKTYPEQRIDKDCPLPDYNEEIERPTIKEQKEINTQFIPYQVCPRCYGEGNIAPTKSFSQFPFQTCDVCHGNQIIPMYVNNKKA